MALVTSNSATLPGFTLPTWLNTPASKAGWLFQVRVDSLHAQPGARWMRPPEGLPAAGSGATCRRSLALTTGRAASPLTLTRTKVRLRFLELPGDAAASSSALVPKPVSGADSRTSASAWTTAGTNVSGIVVVVVAVVLVVGRAVVVVAGLVVVVVVVGGRV